jgi:hypothetical protein
MIRSRFPGAHFELLEVCFAFTFAFIVFVNASYESVARENTR